LDPFYFLRRLDAEDSEQPLYPGGRGITVASDKTES